MTWCRRHDEQRLVTVDFERVVRGQLSVAVEFAQLDDRSGKGIWDTVLSVSTGLDESSDQSAEVPLHLWSSDVEKVDLEVFGVFDHQRDADEDDESVNRAGEDVIRKAPARLHIGREEDVDQIVRSDYTSRQRVGDGRRFTVVMLFVGFWFDHAVRGIEGVGIVDGMEDHFVVQQGDIVVHDGKSDW